MISITASTHYTHRAYEERLAAGDEKLKLLLRTLIKLGIWFRYDERNSAKKYLNQIIDNPDLIISDESHRKEIEEKLNELLIKEIIE